MASKSKTIFVCNECGYESAKWMGKCPACNSWNTFFEQKVDKIVENGIKKTKSFKFISRTRCSKDIYRICRTR